VTALRNIVDKECFPGYPPAEPFPLWVIMDREDHTKVGLDFRERMAEDEKKMESLLRELEKKRRSKYRK